MPEAAGGGAPPAAPQVSAVLVTWNGRALTLRALGALYAATRDPASLQVIVVDNGSTDGTAAAVAAAYPAVEVIALPENVGFARANNRALAAARAPLIFLLNNDTVAAPGSVDALRDAARARPEFAIFATQMLRMDDPGRVDNRGMWLDHAARCRQLDAGLPAEPGRPAQEVFGASGGACVIRREVVDAIALFDESLGSYWEDGDFAIRARAHGYRCWYVPEARILHEGSATGDRLPARKLYLIHRNMAVVVRRWFPFRPWRLAPWLGVALEGYYWVRAARSGDAAVLARAKRDARRLSSGAPRPPRAARGRLDAWVGRRSAPTARA